MRPTVELAVSDAVRNAPETDRGRVHTGPLRPVVKPNVVHRGVAGRERAWVATVERVDANGANVVDVRARDGRVGSQPHTSETEEADVDILDRNVISIVRYNCGGATDSQIQMCQRDVVAARLKVDQRAVEQRH